MIKESDSALNGIFPTSLLVLFLFLFFYGFNIFKLLSKYVKKPVLAEARNNEQQDPIVEFSGENFLSID